MRRSSANTPRMRRSAETASGGPVAPTTEYVGGRNRRSGSGASGSGGGSMLPLRRRSSPIVRRVVLAALLAASLGLITATYRGGVVIHGAQMAVLEVVAPIERGLNRAWDPVAGAWDWTGRLFSAMGENPDLKQENAELRTELRVAEFHEDENDELRKILHVTEQGVYPDSFEPVVGRVWSRPAGSVDRAVMINVGTNDGVSVNDPVMVAEGLIGRVVSVGADNARVGLILDSAQRATAQIVGADGRTQDATGMLETVSTEGVPAMRIQFVKQSAKVEQNDEVVTAGWVSPGDGLKSMYPAGIPIGQVRSAGNSSSDLYKVIQVIPYANFDDLDKVIVLTARDGQAAGYETLPEPANPRAAAAAAITEAARTKAARDKAAATAAAAARAKAAKAAAASAAGGSETGDTPAAGATTDSTEGDEAGTDAADATSAPTTPRARR